MQDQFVPYEVAFAMKELGFDGECFAFYYGKITEQPVFDMGLNLYTENRTNTGLVSKFKDGLCTVPLWQQAFEWFRDEHNIIAYPRYNRMAQYYSFDILLSVQYSDIATTKFCDTFREAELDCLNMIIKILKEKN